MKSGLFATQRTATDAGSLGFSKPARTSCPVRADITEETPVAGAPPACSHASHPS
jgi:hypothetical protein